MPIDWDQIKSIGLPDFAFNDSNLGNIVQALLSYIFPAAGVLVLLYLLWGGLQMMTSGGDPKGVQAAREKITGALIGLLVIFVSFWIVQALASFLGVEKLRESLP